MKTYKITASTNSYIANRDIHFNGRLSYDMNTGMSLKAAQKLLLEFFNIDYGKFYSNWGLVRMNHKFSSSSFNDGTRSYEYDSRYYRIEEEE